MATNVQVLSTQVMSPAGGDDHTSPDNLGWPVVPARILLELRETHRQRQDLLRAELRLNNQIEANYRRLTGLTREERARLRKKASGGDQRCYDTLNGAVPAAADTPDGAGDYRTTDTLATGVPRPDLARAEAQAALASLPLVNARALLAESRKPLEKRMEQLARQLPVWLWVADVRGFGPLSLAQIVGECGDLADYDNPAKVWKRMGLAVIDGQRQRRVSDPDEAAIHGYSPQRRSIMFNVAESLVKLNHGDYRAYYEAEKARQAGKLPDGPKAHIDNRAKRHLAKRLLRDLWRAWRDHRRSDTHRSAVPPAPTDDAGIPLGVNDAGGGRG